MAKRSNEQVLVDDFLDEEFSQQSKYDTRESYFEYAASSKLLADYDLDDDEIERGIVGGGQDGGCDSVYAFCGRALVSEDTDLKELLKRRATIEVLILQCKTSKTFGTDVFLKWKDTCSDLLAFDGASRKLNEKYSDDLLRVFETIRDLIAQGARKNAAVEIKFFDIAIAKGEVHATVKRQAEELKDLVREVVGISNVQVAVNFVGARELLSVWTPLEERESVIRFSDAWVNIRGRSDYIGLVSLVDYHAFLDSDSGAPKAYLFEANVRDYEGRVEVNKAIEETLEEQTGEDFWWMNNGVTILATKAVQATGGEVLLTDPRIVNGLQTSYAIFNYMENNSFGAEEARNVLVRILVPETDETRTKVIKATNSQTTIPKTSLRATDPIHHHIELYMKQRGLYYDRRKNYYKNQGKKPEEIVSIPFLAQCLMTLLMSAPNQARARPSTLLSDEASYQKLFKDDGNLEKYYKAVVAGRKVISALEARRDKYERSQIGDLKFYVLLVVVAKAIGAFPITEEALTTLDPDLITQVDVDGAMEHMVAVYHGMGGDARAAKSSEMAEAVVSELKEYLDQ